MSSPAEGGGLDVGEGGVNVTRKARIDRGQWGKCLERGTVIGKSGTDVRRKG